MNIYLIGNRCCGKTTLGRALANHIGWCFVDMDDRLVTEQGISIAEMVGRDGWPAFRAAERNLLARLAVASDQVVATGGGVVLDPFNIATMRTSGKVVWLRCLAQTIDRRMAADPRSAALRPALTEAGRMEEIVSVLTERAPLYRSAAHITIDTDDIEPGLFCLRMAPLLLGQAKE